MAESILLALAEEERLRNNLAIERRLLREASRPLRLPDKEFTAHFRLRKSQFEDLCADLIPFLPHPKRSTSVSLELKVLAALAFYANGCYQKNVGAFHLLGLSQSMVSKCLNEVTEAINQRQIIQKYIRFPLSRMEREAVAARFMEKFEIPGVIGCIDGTHVAIVRPNQDEEVYFNRKHYHSLNVLIICDADLRILHVDASFGGQSHDSHIWNSSRIKGIMQDLHEEGEVWWLLGDSGYAQRPWLMIPILNAAPNSPEEFYTKKHVHTRNVVERCIGVLKNRWRCLLAHRVMHYDPIKAGKITNACVVLHNLVNNGCITINEEETVEDHARQTLQRPSFESRAFDGGRQALIDRLWGSREPRQ